MMQPTPAPSSPPRSPDRPAKKQYIQHHLRTAQRPFFGPIRPVYQINRRAQARASKWFTLWREQVGCGLYPVLRLILLPYGSGEIYIYKQKDRGRAMYGLKEKNLAKTYIKLIPLGMIWMQFDS
ncbi:hypothetical protein L210DRAFT_3565841 [Boletus edulis BED1]|uniref:Uncharacterized protein n=1 Tax=Boletus edulis BED1 TaxID=1328754 RepID=A0AAD4G7S1_BOLED|nr:hypothetical protein L210DRAFT_3565841 [Boletus edulis BED1]